MSRHPSRAARALPIVLAMSLLLAAGCGSETEDASVADAADSLPGDEVRQVTTPDDDPTLDDALGAAGEAGRDAGCSFGTVEIGEPEHVNKPSWEAFPPAGGQHYGDWAAYGRYDEPVQDGFVVHNLEHGGVTLWHGEGVDEATLDALAGLLDDDEKWLMAPRGDIEGVASAAWGKLLTCPPDALDELGPDEAAALLDGWFEAVESTGSEAEKDVPAFAGGMEDPEPVRDISSDPPDIG